MRHHITHRVVVTALCALVVTACGSSTQNAATTTGPPTAASSDAATSAAPAASASLDTTGESAASIADAGAASTPTTAAGTDATTTTAPAATMTPTSVPATTPTATSGWTVIDPGTVGAPLAYPCCAENWYGSASPPLPMGDEPLADGIYRVDFEWPASFDGPISATVERFERCDVLPPGSCEDNGGFAATDLGVDNSVAQPLTLPLDGSLKVVLGGFTPDGIGNFKVGSGADLAELLTALDADYQAAIVAPALAGSDQLTIANELAASPAHGFGPLAGTDNSGALIYTHGDAPPLLFQALFNNPAHEPAGARGSDLVGRIALRVQGGQMTLTTYAGFYS